MGLVAPRHVRSSPTRARIRVPCIGRQILNHCATREVPQELLIISMNITLTSKKRCKTSFAVSDVYSCGMKYEIENFIFTDGDAALGDLP